MSKQLEADMFGTKVVYKFQTNFDRDHSQDVEKDRLSDVSMTLPDQALTIPEIMSRYARGLPLSGKDGSFEFDEDYDGEVETNYPDLTGKDLAEIQMMKYEADQEVQRLQAVLDEHEKGREELKRKKARELEKRRLGRQLLENAESELQDVDQHLLDDDADFAGEKQYNPNPKAKTARRRRTPPEQKGER